MIRYLHHELEQLPANILRLQLPSIYTLGDLMRKLTDEVDLGAERVGSLLVSNLPLLYPGNGDVTHQEDSGLVTCLSPLRFH